MKKTILISVITIGMFFVSSFAPCIYAAPIEIKIGSIVGTDFWTTPMHAWGTIFKGMVESATDGQVTMKIFPSSQLGGDREQTEGVKVGTIQMALAGGGFATFHKEAQLTDIPYIFSSEPVAWKVLDGWFGRELAQDCLKKTGIRVLAYGEIGVRCFTNSKHPIKTPADMKGLKFRIQPNNIYITMVRALGGAPTPIEWSETYTALQQGVVDGQENPTTVIQYAKLNEVQKYLTLDHHTYGVTPLIINEKFFQSLPKATQDIMKRSAAVATGAMRGLQQCVAFTALDNLKAKGMEVYVPTPKEKAMFKEACQKPVLEVLEKQLGKAWIDKLNKAVAEAEAELGKW